jgi:RND family efflux transporter MFP subunit
MNRLAPVGLSLCCVLTAACSAATEEGSPASAVAQTISVSTARATVRRIPAFFQETGAFLADESSDVAPAVAGRVAATPVDIGDHVSAGQVICELEHRDAELTVAKAQANLEQARFALHQAQSQSESAELSAKLAAADAKRYESLVKSGDVSQSSWERFRTQSETAEAAASAARTQWEGARAAVEASEVQLAQAQKGHADTFVRAPFDGFVTSRPVAVGQSVGTNSKVATVVRIRTLKLQLQLPEHRAADVNPGVAVTARVAAYPDRDFTGKVTAIVPSVDPGSRTFVVEARFENPKGELRPGMFATAKVTLPTSSQVVFVPAAAIYYDKTTDAYEVFTVVGGAARLSIVLKGDTEGERVRILSGLAGDETVVVSNLGELYDGVAVKARS